MTSRKFKVWLDSGANNQSCRTQTVTLEEIGFTSEEWDALEESERDVAMREIAFEHSEWGYTELGGEE